MEISLRVTKVNEQIVQDQISYIVFIFAVFILNLIYANFMFLFFKCNIEFLVYVAWICFKELKEDIFH